MLMPVYTVIQMSCSLMHISSEPRSKYFNFLAPVMHIFAAENVKGDVLFLKHVLICFIANDETLRSYRESYDHAFENETEVHCLFL